MIFPVELGAPCASGFAETPQGNHKRVQFEAGTRVRRRVRARPNTFTLCYSTDLNGRRQLERFHRAASGKVFQIRLPGPDDTLIDHNGRFSGGLQIQPIGAGKYECRFNMHMVDSLLMTRSAVTVELIRMLGFKAGSEAPLTEFLHTLPSRW
ncbi:hypothetical protein [Sansalvadorimonas verongulae]|uniref:hypothetical protein n=1 Tax=Sansalvadorimonas verongulae TaxID=2172824 RepID=UPI0012BB4AE8|nr:hypothetical protein [Sansalvadorimonas verongulae]MTI13117.1 hypothetical protein [Sansalvadorimonas verongulae]